MSSENSSQFNGTKMAIALVRMNFFENNNENKIIYCQSGDIATDTMYSISNGDR